MKKNLEKKITVKFFEKSETLIEQQADFYNMELITNSENSIDV